MLLVMLNWTIAQYVATAICQGALLFLVAALLRSGNWRHFPFFTAYILSNLGQAALLVFSYRYWGPRAPVTEQIFWITAGVTLLARALAIAELVHRILGLHKGIWGLAWRSIAMSVVVIAAYSFFVANRHWDLGLIAAQRALELALGCGIAVLFAFCRYYEVQVPKVERIVGMGLILYSGVVVISHTVLERFFYAYSPFWNLTILTSFFVSAALWIRALWVPVPSMRAQPAMLGQLYQTLSPEINLRLRALDQRLISLWKREAPNS
jgi:hypothetical protein